MAANVHAPAQFGGRGAVQPLAAAAAVTLLFATWFVAGWGGPTVIRYADDIGCATAAAVAGLLAFRAARRIDPLYRQAWLLIALGVLAWLVGDLVWVGLDLATRKTPGLGLLATLFPFLPAFAAAALLRMPSDAPDVSRVRWMLDGALVALAGMFLAWNTMLQRIAAEHLHTVEVMVAAAFPLADIAVLTALVIASIHDCLASLRLRVLTAALGWLAIADSGYAYLSATHQYAAGAFCDVAYIAAFATLAAAATMPDGTARLPRRKSAPRSGLVTLLPYAPFAIAVTVAFVRRSMGHQVGVIGLAMWTAITALVLLRQYLTLQDNRRLLSEVEEQRARLAGVAFTDPVTGLGNRLLFADRVAHALDLHERDRRPVSLCWIDVDDFKVINDTYGHAAGDELLVALAKRLGRALRRGDTVARLGGDEFGVLLEDGAQASAVAAKLHLATDRPFVIDGNRIRVPTSIGLATLGASDPTVGAEELMSRADVAMYAAKTHGKNRVETFQPGMTMPGAEDVALRDLLREHIAAGAIDVHYQPLVTANDGRLHGFEALARWSPRGTPVSPDRFVVLAERLGLARDLGELVLDAALAQLARWTAVAGAERLVMSVNLSPEQLIDPALPGRVAASLARHQVAPSALTLEITERALLTDDPNAIQVARALTELGVVLALDDFGTGYSSLAHLRAFPLGAFKLDRSFVADIDTDPDAHHFLRALIRLGKDLGLQLVAEGVERASQLTVLRELGCDYVQGFLVSRPLPAEAFDRELWHLAEKPRAVRPDAVPMPRAQIARSS